MLPLSVVVCCVCFKRRYASSSRGVQGGFTYKDIRRIVIEDKAGQLDDSGFTVLEKVTSLEDNEEVARLAGEAKGRKGFCCHFLQFYAQSCALHIGV